jgi:hypothetical protein
MHAIREESATRHLRSFLSWQHLQAGKLEKTP